MSRAFISRFRFYSLAAAIIACFAVVLFRIAYLQVWHQEVLRDTVDTIRDNFITLQARRGDIVDSKGNVLATTRASVELGVDPQMLRTEDEERWPLLAKLINKPLPELQKLFAKREVKNTHGETHRVRWQKIADSIDEVTYEEVQKLNIKGVYGNHQYERVYPSGSLAAHILGFVNKEGVASGGIEQRMDFYLRGQNGWIETEKDGHRHEVACFRRREVPAVNGNTVELTIDLGIQHAIEEALQRIANEYNPISASIIVSNPKTGYILGLANWPTFDPNFFWKAPMEVLKDRAITDVYEPGSTFKIVVSSAALNEGLITVDQRFDCAKNTIEYKGKLLKLPHDWQSMSVLSVREIIAQSSNRGMANIGVILGPEKIYGYAWAYGYGHLTGYGMPGEVVGIMHPPRAWDELTITRMPMGHAICATAMQVHCAMGSIANRGVLMRPQIVRCVRDPAGTQLFSCTPKARHRVILEKTALVMTDLLEKHALRIKNYSLSVAGKTGTTQKIINGQYSHSQHIASFTGFFPKQDPQVSITVVIDSPKVAGTAYGSQIAAPQFLKLAEAVAQYLGIRSPDNF